MKFEPELLKFKDGTEVKTEEDWAKRREEILDILREYEYGKSPEKPKEVKGEIISADGKCCSGHATLEKIKISFETEKGEFSFPITFFKPDNGKKNPLIVLINFRPDDYDMYFPAEEIIENGFALAVVCYDDIVVDEKADLDKIALMYDGYTWGKISMWAFGASRAIDYLITRDEVDENNIAVAGHSRLGKTALWCSAQDERVKFAISNDSGCCGAAYERIKHDGAETVDSIIERFPYWFCDKFNSYHGRADELPFDQHYLIALTAPRYVCIGSASEDNWADQYSEQLCCMASSPVWKLFGKDGYIGKTDEAEVGEDFSDGDISYHLRDGVHFFGRQDWLSYMKFIKNRLK